MVSIQSHSNFSSPPSVAELFRYQREQSRAEAGDPMIGGAGRDSVPADLGRIASVRAQIAAGTYDTPQKLDGALDRLISQVIQSRHGSASD